MRLTLSAIILGLTFAAPANRAAATPISPGSADCSVNPTLCAFIPSIVTTLGVSAGTKSDHFISPATGQNSASYSESDINMFGFSAAASGAIAADYSGIHTTLSGSGSPGFDVIGGLGGIGGGANSFGSIIDYFGVGNDVPAGSFLSITYSADANGTSGHTLNSNWSSSISTGLEINSGSFAFPETCTNGTGATGLNGSFATTCTTTVPITSLDVIGVTLQLIASAQSNDGQALLDAANTVKLSSVLIVDSHGNPLSDIQLYDASGYDYNAVGDPVPPSPVPEPSAILLFATGSLGLVNRIRARGRQS
jgi:hypothetical protein